MNNFVQDHTEKGTSVRARELFKETVRLPSLPCGNYSLLSPLQFATAVSVPATPIFPAQLHKKCCFFNVAQITEKSHLQKPHILY